MTRSRLPIQLERIAAYCREHGIRRRALFGSALRPDLSPTSDVDVLIEFLPGRATGQIGFSTLERDLSAFLGRTVDANTPDIISSHYLAEILAEAEDLPGLVEAEDLPGLVEAEDLPGLVEVLEAGPNDPAAPA